MMTNIPEIKEFVQEVRTDIKEMKYEVKDISNKVHSTDLHIQQLVTRSELEQKYYTKSEHDKTLQIIEGHIKGIKDLFDTHIKQTSLDISDLSKKVNGAEEKSKDKTFSILMGVISFILSIVGAIFATLMK